MTLAGIGARRNGTEANAILSSVCLPGCLKSGARHLLATLSHSCPFSGSSNYFLLMASNFTDGERFQDFLASLHLMIPVFTAYSAYCLYHLQYILSNVSVVYLWAFFPQVMFNYQRYLYNKNINNSQAEDINYMKKNTSYYKRLMRTCLQITRDGIGSKCSCIPIITKTE